MKPLNLLLFFTLLCIVSIHSCKQEAAERPAENPVLEITSGDISVDPAGQECSVSYTITGIAENGIISARCLAEWIETLDYGTEGVVTFTALPNENDSDRSTTLTVIYTYGEGLAVKDSISIHQSADTETVDYKFEMKELYGIYYGVKYGQNGEYSYFTTLSDLPYGADGYSQPGGTYYILDMFGPAPENGSYMCPVGTYTLGEPGATEEFTFTPDISFAATISEDGETRTMNVTFTEGTIDVSKDENGYYVIEADMVDNEGKKHHVSYAGDEGIWKDDSAPDIPPYGVIDMDLNITATSATSKFIGANGIKTLMTVNLSFTDMSTDEDGNAMSPGSILDIQGMMQYNTNGYLTEGEYNVIEGADYFILVPGEIEDLFGTPAPIGTYAQYIDEDNYSYYGAIKAGTMTISGPGYGWYTIEWDFTTAEGHKITGSWTGNLPTEMPKEFSTLESDYTLDLTGTEASATYYGDWYVNGGGNWQISLYPPLGVTGGDGLLIDLNAEKLGYEAGIPSGTYKAGADDYPESASPNVGEYRRGYLKNGKPTGTVYVGNLDGLRNPGEMAPATEGDLTITANENGTYTLKFSFLDDMGHTWDGEWTGNISLSKYPFATDAPIK